MGMKTEEKRKDKELGMRTMRRHQVEIAASHGETYKSKALSDLVWSVDARFDQEHDR